jgi:hypothetical protein
MIRLASGGERLVKLQITIRWLGNWVALLLLSMFVAEGVHFTTPEVDPGAMQITLALCCSWLAVLLLPADGGNKTRAGAVTLWAVASAAGFLILSSPLPFFGHGIRIYQLAGSVLILILLFSAVQSLIHTYTSSRASALTLFTLLAAAFIAAPLYLSVLAEATSNQTLVVDSIIAASPVSYLAGIADYDYLRSGWFYQHMPFGGLRFNYPAPGFMTVFYVITTLVLAGANSLANRPAIRRPKP